MRHSVYSRIKNTPMAFKLSVLIATLASRSNNLKSLLEELTHQIQTKPVQIIWMGDNKSITIGEKRNNLLSLAKGEFVSFIDDDDSIADNYISTLLKAIQDNPQKTVICFRGTQNTDGHQDLPFQYDVNFGRNFKKAIDGHRWKVMLPDHLCCWNRGKLIPGPFPNKRLGEDHDFARKMAFTYTEEDQVLLEETLYHYNYDRTLTECRR